MKPLPLIIAIAILSFTACNSRSKQDPKTAQAEEVPKPLQEGNSSSSLISKRSYDDDLVESLYRELAKNSEDLKKLEKDIDEISEMKIDSSKSFFEFNNKNERFFKSAEGHMQTIKDSMLRKKVVDLLLANRNRFDAKIGHHKAILNAIDTKDATLDDLFQVLKIVKTIPIMEKYQRDQITSAKSMESVSNKLDKTIAFADTLIK